MFKKLKKDSYNHKGWLQSDHFIKRALAVLGYYLSGVMIIYAFMAVTMIGIALIAIVIGLVWELVF